MMSVTEAVQLVLSEASALPAETIQLPEAAGRILAEDIIAESDLPPFERGRHIHYLHAIPTYLV